MFNKKLNEIYLHKKEITEMLTVNTYVCPVTIAGM